jgi:hypothetical protein
MRNYSRRLTKSNFRAQNNFGIVGLEIGLLKAYYSICSKGSLKREIQVQIR